jgi:hypothetical protein
MVFATLKGWSRFSQLYLPDMKTLEAFSEQIYNAAESVPDGKITISE